MISRSTFKYQSAALLASWGLVVAAGIFFLEDYAARPGEASTPPSAWPLGSSIIRDGRRQTLLIFLHPQCPCSRASLAELAYIMDRSNGQISANAMLLHTPLLTRWGPSEIERDLAGLPQVVIWQDSAGAEARRFKVMTSGQVLLYDALGRLRFSGGITAARGHQGDNYGRAAVLRLVLGEAGGQTVSPVFGCPLTANAAEPPRLCDLCEEHGP